MNLEESDKFVEKQRQIEQKKKIVLVSIVLCFILMALLAIMIIYLQYQDAQKLKMYIDGTEISISSNMFYQENNTTYINVKSFSELMGYTYTKGEYKKYNENVTSCYIKNNLEVVAMTVGSNMFTKYIEVNYASNVLAPEGPYGIEMQVESANGESDTYILENPMKLVDNQIYMPFDILTDVYNVSVNTSEQNRIRIYTLPFLFKSTLQNISQLGYSTISGVYENIRAIPYGLLVVGNNGVFGVINTTSGQELLSVKYERLQFIQNAREFFMRAENTVGLLDKDGNTIIKPTDYDDISILDEIEQLYLVKKDGKYGVLNRNGDILIHVDYDRIGLNKIEEFGIEDMRNQYLLHDKCIVVQQNSSYGLFNTKGDELLKTTLDGFGYKTTSTDISGEESVLLIPSRIGIKGIVINYGDLYGIFDVNKGDIIIPCSCTRIYSITKVGETKYYMEFANEQIELENYLEAYNLKSENINSSTQANEVESTVENQPEAETTEEQVPEEQDEEVVVENQ